MSTRPAADAPLRAPAFLPAFLRAIAVLFVLQLRRALHLRSTLFAALAALLPVAMAALILWLTRESRFDSPPVLEIVWMLLVRGVVPLAALLVGAGVVAEEVDDRTITYLFVRPFPRAALLLGRWLAAALILSLFLGLSSVAVIVLLEQAVQGGEASDMLTEGIDARIVVAVIAGGLVYSALFASAGTFLRHPVIVGAGYVFAVEGLLGSLPGEGQALTVQYYLKSYLVAGDDEVRRLVELIPEAISAVELVDAGAAASTLAWIGGVALALGALVLTRRQLVLPS